MAYKAVIGLEFHCEMKSNTKVFSNARNSFSKVSNKNVAPIDMAFPGTLPVVNKTCVKKALMMSMILNCRQPEYMEFDRKNYYYPDLPKGYQLTQFFNPVGVDGKIEIDVNGNCSIIPFLFATSIYPFSISCLVKNFITFLSKLAIIA